MMMMMMVMMMMMMMMMVMMMMMMLLFLPNLGGLGEAREEVRADESGDAVCTIDVSDGEAKYGRGDDEGGRDWKGGRVARVTRVPFEQSSSVSPG